MRRGGQSRQPTKVQRGGHKARKAAGTHVSTDLSEQFDSLKRERDEALEQQTATADVLKVISRSAFDLRTVLQTLVESAARLCDADKGTITRERDGAFYRAEAYGFSSEFMDYVKDIPIKAEKGSASGRALLERRVVHIPDAVADPEYTWMQAQKLGDFRTVLAVPMLRGGNPIGVLTLTRREVRPFTDKQIELVTTFADQAAIAIENTRLFNELRQRTDDLSESLEQQTATSEVLRVISSSPTDLAPVFETILGTATRLCEGNLAALWRYDGKLLVGAAQYNASPAFVSRYMGAVMEPSRQGPVRLAALERRTVHVADITVEPGFSPQVLQYERARTVHCSGKRIWLVSSQYGAVKFGRSAISRSSWCRALRRKR